MHPVLDGNSFIAEQCMKNNLIDTELFIFARKMILISFTYFIAAGFQDVFLVVMACCLKNRIPINSRQKRHNDNRTESDIQAISQEPGFSALTRKTNAVYSFVTKMMARHKFLPIGIVLVFSKTQNTMVSCLTKIPNWKMWK